MLMQEELVNLEYELVLRILTIMSGTESEGETKHRKSTTLNRKESSIRETTVSSKVCVTSESQSCHEESVSTTEPRVEVVSTDADPLAEVVSTDAEPRAHVSPHAHSKAAAFEAFATKAKQIQHEIVSAASVKKKAAIAQLSIRPQTALEKLIDVLPDSASSPSNVNVKDTTEKEKIEDTTEKEKIEDTTEKEKIEDTTEKEKIEDTTEKEKIEDTTEKEKIIEYLLDSEDALSSAPSESDFDNSNYNSEEAEQAEQAKLKEMPEGGLKYAVVTSMDSHGKFESQIVQMRWLDPAVLAPKADYTHIWYPPKRFWGQKLYDACLADPGCRPTPAGWVQHTLAKIWFRNVTHSVAEAELYQVLNNRGLGDSATCDPVRSQNRKNISQLFAVKTARRSPMPRSAPCKKLKLPAAKETPKPAKPKPTKTRIRRQKQPSGFDPSRLDCPGIPEAVVQEEVVCTRKNTTVVVERSESPNPQRMLAPTQTPLLPTKHSKHKKPVITTGIYCYDWNITSRS